MAYFWLTSEESDSPAAKTAKERLAKIRSSVDNSIKAFSVVWGAHAPSAVAMAACSIIGAFLPASQAWVGKVIVDSVVGALNAHLSASDGLRLALPWLAAELFLVIIQAANGQARKFAEHVLHARVNLRINSLIVSKALELDLAYFENSEYYDKLQNARREADWRSLQIVNGSFYLGQNVITLISFGALLVRFSPWLAVLLFAATLPAFIAQSQYAELNFRVLSWRAPEARKLQYLEYLLTDYDSVKEVKLFELGNSLLGRYTSLFWKFLKEDQVIAARRSWASLGWGLLATLSYYGAYAWIVWKAVGGDITLGDMTLYLGVARSSQSMFDAIFYGLSDLYENGLFMSNLFAYLALTPTMPAAHSTTGVPVQHERGIEFRNVSFRYEGQTEWTLQNISLNIGAGEKIALVGLNGAGKTTLIKLLTRLYDPTEGQILLDGIDLRELALTDLRRRIGVIFQDFVKYHLPARENVGFGQIEALADEPRIISAAKKSGADELISAMPDGYSTILGRWFARGRDLSGGEWQRVALSRAFMRDCDIIVLDEPTAALDAENETRVFQQFRELTAGKTAVLISHRFSTVRMADRIIVLADGQVAEQGSHDVLLNAGGTYARLFMMQAESYR